MTELKFELINIDYENDFLEDIASLNGFSSLQQWLDAFEDDKIYNDEQEEIKNDHTTISLRSIT